MGLLRWRVLMSLIYTMTFFVSLDANIICKKGHRISRSGKTCEPCPKGNYMPEENSSKKCRACTRCNPKFGSTMIQPCSKTVNAKCQCNAGFIPWETDSATCKCDDGFEVKNDGTEMDDGSLLPACHKCEDGYFSKSGDSPCSKWKECKSTEVKVNGTKASDVVCNDEPKTDSTTPTPAPSNVTQVKQRPSEHVQTQELPQRSTTTSPPGHEVSTKVKWHPVPPSTDNSPGMAVLLTLGIVGLIILSAVTCKLNIIPCIQNNKPLEHIKDSSYRRPVEESGDSNCSTLLEP